MLWPIERNYTFYRFVLPDVSPGLVGDLHFIKNPPKPLNLPLFPQSKDTLVTPLGIMSIRRYRNPKP
jgi:hypothetical protein